MQARVVAFATVVVCVVAVRFVVNPVASNSNHDGRDAHH
jgi:hypothetical protein